MAERTQIQLSDENLSKIADLIDRFQNRKFSMTQLANLAVEKGIDPLERWLDGFDGVEGGASRKQKSNQVTNRK